LEFAKGVPSFCSRVKFQRSGIFNYFYMIIFFGKAKKVHPCALDDKKIFMVAKTVRIYFPLVLILGGTNIFPGRNPWNGGRISSELEKNWRGHAG